MRFWALFFSGRCSWDRRLFRRRRCCPGGKVNAESGDREKRAKGLIGFSPAPAARGGDTLQGPKRPAIGCSPAAFCREESEGALSVTGKRSQHGHRGGLWRAGVGAKRGEREGRRFPSGEKECVPGSRP